jgi:hypothetical protein
MASKLEAVADDLAKGKDASPAVNALTDHDLLLLILEVLVKRFG